MELNAVIDSLRAAINSYDEDAATLRRWMARDEPLFSPSQLSLFASYAANADTISMVRAAVEHCDDAGDNVAEQGRWIGILITELERRVFSYGGGSSTNQLANEVDRLAVVFRLTTLRRARGGLY